MVQQAALKSGVDINLRDMELPTEDSDLKAVHFHLTKYLDNETRNEITNGLKKMEHLALNLLLVNEGIPGNGFCF